MKAAAATIDADLIAEVCNYCVVIGADPSTCLNEAVRDWLESSASARLHFFYKRQGLVMPDPYSNAEITIQ